MTLWFFRILTIIIGPVIGWYEISSDAKGIAIGVVAALFIIAVEIIIERVPLNHLLFGIIGAALGLVFSYLLNEAILLINDAKLSAVAHKVCAARCTWCMTYLGMVISVPATRRDRSAGPRRGDG